MEGFKVTRMLKGDMYWMIRYFRSMASPPPRSYSTVLNRTPVQVFEPKEGEVPARESLEKLQPRKKKGFENSLAKKIETSAELFKAVMGTIHTTKGKSLIALEGERLVEEGLKFGLNAKFLFVTKPIGEYRKIAELAKGLLPTEMKNDDGNGRLIAEIEKAIVPKLRDRSPIYTVTTIAMATWSSLTTPPGIIGVFMKPSESNRQKAQLKTNGSPVPLTVILDNVRDPGNLGSILRTSAGIGCRVLLSRGCADPWEMKALRGGNGAQFMIPMTTNVFMNHLQNHMDELMQGTITTTTDPEGDEAKESGKGIGIFLAESPTEEGPSSSSSDQLKLPFSDYTSFDYSSFSAVYLVLGGETHGISKTTRRNLAELQKIYPENIKTVASITIPMCFPVDSLNVANAFGIIGYEIARQCKIKM